MLWKQLPMTLEETRGKNLEAEDLIEISIAGSHVHIFLCLSTCVRVFVVKNGSRHAVYSIQQTSNSLFPWELHEIVHAKAEVIGEFAKIDMLLKAKRGEKE
ncbi:hypothetical protein RHGRI_023611 [Rhododendron griersonianum]|uniref:Uncharacterized protein n=1 Tax=Rhododendron griersonianum TaxID=479676 RepID=A0AAV6J9M8_9ERIC|nr:hypothetical protein RHGRI_023611 [Rhododendron griersonianum]